MTGKSPVLSVYCRIALHSLIPGMFFFCLFVFKIGEWSSYTVHSTQTQLHCITFSKHIGLRVTMKFLVSLNPSYLLIMSFKKYIQYSHNMTFFFHQKVLFFEEKELKVTPQLQPCFIHLNLNDKLKCSNAPD